MAVYEKLTKDNKWVLDRLKDYGNCCCNKLRKKYGEENLLNILRKEGFECKVVVVEHNEEVSKRSERLTYILEVVSRDSLRSRR